MISSEVLPSIECPRCGWRSFNHGDVEHRYCKRCREFHDQMGEPGDAARGRAGQGRGAPPRHVLLRIVEFPLGRYRLGPHVVVLHQYNETGVRVRRCVSCDVLVLTEHNDSLARSRHVTGVSFDQLTPVSVNERLRADAIEIARARNWLPVAM